MRWTLIVRVVAIWLSTSCWLHVTVCWPRERTQTNAQRRRRLVDEGNGVRPLGAPTENVFNGACSEKTAKRRLFAPSTLPDQQQQKESTKALFVCPLRLGQHPLLLSISLVFSSPFPDTFQQWKEGVGKGEKCQSSSGCHFHWNPHCRRETWMQVLLLAPSGSPAKSSQELKRNRKTFHVTCTMHTTCTLTTQRDTYNCN